MTGSDDPIVVSGNMAGDVKFADFDGRIGDANGARAVVGVTNGNSAISSVFRQNERKVNRTARSDVIAVDSGNGLAAKSGEVRGLSTVAVASEIALNGDGGGVTRRSAEHLAGISTDNSRRIACWGTDVEVRTISR